MLIESILEQVQRDIASFADPGTQVEITDRSISWYRSRVRVTAQLIRKPNGFPDISHGGREYSYTSFLSSEILADLRDLATTIQATSAPPSHYIPVLARMGSSLDGNPSIDAADLILSQTVTASTLPLMATRVLFVHGNAGTGKTSTLLHVCRMQAERYLRGEASTLLLYLDAQGKGLSQLEDVMARALQDLRAKFTYHSVAALTRRHCVVPVVDGFDELIGPSSAREAFSNLAQFLSQLDCEGALIASSRSAFIDYRTLYERASELAASQKLAYEIDPIEVLEWGDEAIENYCEERAPAGGDLIKRVLALKDSDAGDLVRKPFFLSKICDILLDGGVIDGSIDIPRQVVEAALSREASKLRDARGKELLSKDQHRVFCEAIADEMWALGSPELDCESIRLLAELVAEQFKLDSRDTKTLVDRSIAHGLLSVVHGRVPEKRAFEHELFRFEFQAGSLTKLLESGADAGKDYIRRAELPIEIVSRIAKFGFTESNAIRKVLDSINEIVASAPNNQFSPTNGGSIAWALLRNRKDAPKELRLCGLYLRAHDFGDCMLDKAEIIRCVYERVNLSRMIFRECKFDDSLFIGCSLGSGTSWVGSQLKLEQFSGVVHIRDLKNVIEIYNPSEILALLKSQGADVTAAEGYEITQTMEPEVNTRVEIVERLLTHARNHFYLSREDPWFQNNLADSKPWSLVEPLLKKKGLLEEVSPVKSGRPEAFLRLTSAPDKILEARSGHREGIPIAAVEFWNELSAMR